MEPEKMLAFTNTEVDKSMLLRVLAKHEDADRIIQGHYWDTVWVVESELEVEKGCAVGCTLHDFRPGDESHHRHYEELFGIPEALAQIEDGLFEALQDKADYQGWPMRFTSAIPVGADLSDVELLWNSRMKGIMEEAMIDATSEGYSIVDIVGRHKRLTLEGKSLASIACDALIELLQSAPVHY